MANPSDIKIKLDLSDDVKKAISAFRSMAELVSNIGQNVVNTVGDDGETEVLREQLEEARSHIRTLATMNDRQTVEIKAARKTLNKQSEELEQMTVRFNGQAEIIDTLRRAPARHEDAQREANALLADAQRQAAADRETYAEQTQKVQDLLNRIDLMQITLTSEINRVSGWEDFDGTPESTVGAATSVIKGFLDSSQYVQKNDTSEELAMLKATTPEARTDPGSGGNTFVLRGVAVNHINDPLVAISDIMGSHERMIHLREWLSWDKLA